MNEVALRARKSGGWLMGMGNLWRREAGAWWGSRRWLRQGLGWLLGLGGFVALLAFVLPAYVQVTADDTTGAMNPLLMGIQGYFQLGVTAMAVGAVIVAQGSLLGELESGVSEWILSKPVSRQAYLLSKLLANGLAMGVLWITLPGVASYGLLSLANGEALPVGTYLVALFGVALHTSLYLTLTCLLSVLAAKRGAVLGIGLGLMFGGQILTGLVSEVAAVTPWGLVSMLAALVAGMPLPNWMIVAPMAVTSLATLLMIAITLMRFGRVEIK